jgi:hypothetical protein
VEQPAALVQILAPARSPLVPRGQDLDGRYQPSAGGVADFDPGVRRSGFHDGLQHVRRRRRGLADALRRRGLRTHQTDVGINRLNRDAAFVHHVEALLGQRDVLRPQPRH